MSDGADPRAGLGRMAKSVLRPLRATAGRFVQPAFDARFIDLQAQLSAVHAATADAAERAAALEDHLEALRATVSEAAAGTAALEERLETVRQAAASGVDRTGVLEERLASSREETTRDIEHAAAALGAAVTADRAALRRSLLAEVERTRSRLDVPDSEVIALEEFRSSTGYERIYVDPEPLVSVTIATYDRAELLVERCLPSVLAQDYRNLEIIVVGDGCTDDTEARVRAIPDDRITFVGLEERTVPAAVGRGSDALNLARAMATGALLTHLDDDDEYTPDRIGRLVRYLQETRSELVWHPFWWQESLDADWSVNDADALEFSKVTSGAVLYLGWFRRIRWDPLSKRYRTPGDWTLFRTLRDLGIKARRYPVPLLRHYAERQNPRLLEGPDEGRMRISASALLRSRGLIPEIGSELEYEALLGQTEAWLPAVVTIGQRAGIVTKGLLTPTDGEPFPTLGTARGHVVRLYGPWRGGAEAYQREVRAMEMFGRLPGRPVPKLLSSGPLDANWWYTLTTAIPGVPLSAVRGRMPPGDVERLAGWLARALRDLHATPLSEGERAEGWQAFSARIAERHASAQDTLSRRGTLPGRLAAQVRDWLPDLAELLPGPEVAVLLHGGVDAENVLGIWRGGRFDPTGLRGIGRALIGHPYHELGASLTGLARGDVGPVRAFLREVRWPGADGPGFPRLALAFVLLDEVDRLPGLPGLEESADLDELALGLFGLPAGALTPVER